MNSTPIKLFFTSPLRGIVSRFYRALSNGQYPTFLLLNVTERCNCRCTMCHIWEKKQTVELSLEDLIRLFHDPLLNKINHLSLTGGEPFLRRDLKDIIIQASKSLPRLKRISFPSNGLLPSLIESVTINTLEELPDHITLKIGISLDGPREIHNQMRGVTGAFEKAVESVKRLGSLNRPNFEVGILALVSRENLSCLPETHELLSSLCPRITWTLATEAKFFNNVDKETDTNTREPDSKILEFIEKTLIPLYPEKAYLYTKYMDHILKKVRTYPCLAGYRSAYIDTRGNLLPCHYLNEKFALANFLKGSTTLEEAWFSTKARQIRGTLKNHPYCRNCSNNCDFRNLIKEDFWNFFFYLITHPVVPLKVLLGKKRGQGEKNV